jgi:urease accessory protein UreF
MLNGYQEAIKDKRASGVYPVALAVCSKALGISKYFISKNVFSLLLVASAVAVVLVMAERIGLISPDVAEREENP